MQQPFVVALGGGHGLAATIRAARRYAGHVTAIVATADDGGSSGRLREKMVLPAPGDVRRCLVAMAGAEGEPLGQAFEHRFGGTDVEGHALGNLLLAGLSAVTGDFVAACDETATLLGVDPARGRVMPATVDPSELHAVTADGRQVAGQVAVSETEGIDRVWLEPAGIKPPVGLYDEILRADQILLGPGSLYTSVLAASVVSELTDALAAAEAQTVYICNLRSDVPESRGYDVCDHVDALTRHGISPDVVLADSGSPLEPGALADRHPQTRLVTAAVARPHGLAHDSSELADTLSALL